MVDDVSDAADRVQNPGKYPSLNTAATISLSTKKLASDRASNKKRLQQYRGKVKKTLSSKLESMRTGDAEDDSSKSTTKRPDGSLGHAARVPPAAVKPTFNINDMLQSSGRKNRMSTRKLLILLAARHQLPPHRHLRPRLRKCYKIVADEVRATNIPCKQHIRLNFPLDPNPTKA